jgi:hypothetical protein
MDTMDSRMVLAVVLFAAVFGGGFVIGYTFCIRGMNDTVRFISSIRVAPETGAVSADDTPPEATQKDKEGQR